MKKRIGTISYNIYCNFTNYGSALQTWALHQAIKKAGKGNAEPVLVDYCPDVLADKDPLNPFPNMWDQDAQSKKNCELSLPAIRENYRKFDRFYHERFTRTAEKYTSENFEDVASNEKLDGFVCGSDTIFCIDEFGGFDDGYYANYGCMKNGYTVAYAASFGDAHFDEKTYKILYEKLNNFKYIGIRENSILPLIQENVPVLAQRVIDPTLLLEPDEYDYITADKQEEEKYLLLYVRRYNPAMEAYAEKLAAENGWKLVEISLRATNAEKHRMFYEAGVEEFLSLVKNAEFVVTNSFHGAIFAVQFSRPFYVFSREQCDNKIEELLSLFGLSDRIRVNGAENEAKPIDYADVHNRIAAAREKSLLFLQKELEGLN